MVGTRTRSASFKISLTRPKTNIRAGSFTSRAGSAYLWNKKKFPPPSHWIDSSAAWVLFVRVQYSLVCFLKPMVLKECSHSPTGFIVVLTSRVEWADCFASLPRTRRLLRAFGNRWCPSPSYSLRFPDVFVSFNVLFGFLCYIVFLIPHFFFSHLILL